MDPLDQELLELTAAVAELEQRVRFKRGIRKGKFTKRRTSTRVGFKVVQDPETGEYIEKRMSTKERRNRRRIAARLARIRRGKARSSFHRKKSLRKRKRLRLGRRKKSKRSRRR